MEVYPYIVKKYDVDSTSLKASADYYAALPEEYKKLLEEVQLRLAQMEEEITKKEDSKEEAGEGE